MKSWTPYLLAIVLAITLAGCIGSRWEIREVREYQSHDSYTTKPVLVDGKTGNTWVLQKKKTDDEEEYSWKRLPRK